MHRITNLLLFLLLAATLIIMIWQGQPGTLSWWGQAFGFMAWASVPYAILWVANNIVVQEEPRRDVVLLLTTIAVCGYGAWSLANAFYLNVDSQSGAVFAIMPLWQAIAALAGGLIAFLLPKSS